MGSSKFSVDITVGSMVLLIFIFFILHIASKATFGVIT